MVRSQCQFWLLEFVILWNATALDSPARGGAINFRQPFHTES